MADRSARSTSETVRDTAQWLFRAIRTLRAYPLDNEVAKHALAELVPRVRQVLPLTLDVSAEQLRVEGSALLDDRGATPPLVADLCRDGIRRIRLEVGLNEDELCRFLLVLATPLDPENITEDYVTRLWEAALPHVRVSAVDPYLDAAISEEVLEGRQEPVAQEAVDQESTEEPQQVATAAPPDEAFQITAAERARVSEEVRAATGGPSWEAFAQAIFDTLSLPLGEERRLASVGLLEAAVHGLVKELRLGTAAQILQQLRAQPPDESLVESALTRMADAERLVPLHEGLEEGQCNADEVVSLLVALAPESVPAVCSFLERAHAERAQRAYVDAIGRIGHPATHAVVQGFRSRQGPVRRSYARALGGLGGEAVVAVLINGLSDADPEIRREVARALARQPDSRAAAALIRISVADPDATTRMVALRGLAGARTRQDSSALASRIASRQYRALSDEEKDLLFRALGALGDSGAELLLRRILRPRWIRGLERRDDWPRAAAALARLATPPARQAPQALSEHHRADLATVGAGVLRASHTQHE
jgi:HEAT repeat protein